MPRPARARRFAALAAALALAPACQGPGLAVDTSEADAAIYIDGVLAGTGIAEVEQRYYGTARVTVAPLRHVVTEDLRPAQRFALDLPSPAPRWLFPLDFLLEAFARGFGDAADTAASFSIPPAESSLADGVRPQIEPLRGRAAAIQVAR